MWPYFGSKRVLAKYYPAPRYGMIIEPFAGAAGYSLKWFDRDIVLVDKFDVIIKVWKWLQVASERDVLSLPIPKDKEDIRTFGIEPEGALYLMGFLTQLASAHVTYYMTKSAADDVRKLLKYISGSLYKIRHWKLVNGDYLSLANVEATWFIDPPYQFGGENYVKHNRKMDYKDLASWSMQRRGQVIVCENTKADWMDFKPMRNINGVVHKSTEALWSNLPTEYDQVQIAMF